KNASEAIFALRGGAGRLGGGAAVVAQPLDQFGATANAELVVEVVQMRGNRRRRHVQAQADFAKGEAVGDVLGDLVLTGGDLGPAAVGAQAQTDVIAQRLGPGHQAVNDVG